MRRHRLFALFIILIALSSLDNIIYIVYPIAGLLANSASNYLKAFSLMFVSAIIFFIAKSQAEFIKGGVFRNYIDSVYIKNYFNKIIEILVNTIALNIIILSFVLAYIYIDHWFVIDNKKLLVLKFFAAWLAIIAIQMNVVYNNRIKAALSILFLSIIAFSAYTKANELYLFAAIGSLWLFSYSDSKMRFAKNSFASNTARRFTGQIIKFIPSFAPQIGCLRANPNKFICVIHFIALNAAVRISYAITLLLGR